MERLGPRLRSPATQLTAYAGVLDDTNTSIPVAILIQQPNKVRIDLAGSRQSVLTFDGSASRFSAALSKLEDDILESLTTDTPEGFLDAIRRGAAFRLLGMGFRPSRREYPNYTGPAWDIFQINADIRIRRSAQAAVKRYYFDNATGLLASVRYEAAGTPGPAPVHGETRLSGWRTVNGSPLPSRIERVENGNRIFAVDLPTAALEARRDDSVFRATATVN